MSTVTAQADASSYDATLIGAGGAGVTLLHALATHPQPRPLRILVCDDQRRLQTCVDDRTWAFWALPAVAAYVGAEAVWHQACVTYRSRRTVLHLAPYVYAMVRAAAYYQLVAKALAAQPNLTVDWVGSVDDVHAVGDAVHVRQAGVTYVSRWAFDSRPTDYRKGAKAALLQHFYGSYIETATDVFDPTTPQLMDFSVPQPGSGTAFGYVLPASRRAALVEYTEFSEHIYDDTDIYRNRLRDYTRSILGATDYRSVHDEFGVIPMSDARPVRPRGRLVPIGTRGGATRPATGYTFVAMLQQARHIAAALHTGRSAYVPRPYPRRHRVMDGMLLAGLASGAVDGPAFFHRLFTRNPTQRLLGFLDGTSSLGDDLAVMASAKPVPMLHATGKWLTTRREGT